MTELIDSYLRHQIFLEGAKLGVARATAMALVSDIERELSRIFSRVKTDDLGLLNVKERRSIDYDIRKQVDTVISRHVDRVLRENRKFSTAESQRFRTILRKAGNTLPATMITNASLWARTRNNIIPAVGRTMPQMLQALRLSILSAVLTSFNSAVANRESPSVALRSMPLAKIAGWTRSTVSTVVQNTSAVANSSISGRVFDRYRWVSVLDEVTTQVCTERHMRTYRYGEGPLPPAHYNCRSVTIPDDGSLPPESFVEWLEKQPHSFINEAFKKGDRTLDNVKIISLPQFADKFEIILI